MRGVRKNSAHSMALSSGGLMQRFSFGVLVAVASGLLVLSLLRPAVNDRVRLVVSDTFAPVLALVAAPVSTISGFVATVSSVTDLRAENERLQAENLRLREYQTAVTQLEAENKGLRNLLNMKPDAAHRVVTARVIADAGGPFVRNVVVLAGTPDGVRNGLVAMADGGLAGRVIASGRNSSRVLLINDLNARVPVLLEVSRTRGMLAGNNSPDLMLTQMPPGAQVKPGERLVTSGVGGIYPPGLPVGVVQSVGADGIKVQPLADLGRLEILEVLDPGTPPDLLTPEATQTLPALSGSLQRR